MKRLPVAEEDRRSVKEWYDRWSGYVADVNFTAARPTFAEDAIAFGSKVEVMTSQAQLEAEQWRSVWPSIENYRFDTSTLELIMSPDEYAVMVKLRRLLGALDDQQAINLLLDQLRKTRTNIEFLMQVAKTTPGNDD